jgi:hypothetical protein
VGEKISSQTQRGQQGRNSKFKIPNSRAKGGNEGRRYGALS